jgi:hypothetical protein
MDNGGIDALRIRLGGRAAGFWRLQGDRLEQVPFSSAGEIPAEVVAEFVRATRSVPLDRGDLGIVRAIGSGSMVVSRAADAPTDSGSGLWLRRFSARHSVATPVRDASDVIQGVVSIAVTLPGVEIADVVEALDRAPGTWALEDWPDSGRTRLTPGQ